MSTMNRLGNVNNPYQGEYKKVLCVCSAGLLRSPTAALVLSQAPYGYNTRAAGLNSEFALVCVDRVLLAWADEIVCMELDQADELRSMTTKPVLCLEIDDNYRYRDERLQALIVAQYDRLSPNEAEK